MKEMERILYDFARSRAQVTGKILGKIVSKMTSEISTRRLQRRSYKKEPLWPGHDGFDSLTHYQNLTLKSLTIFKETKI